MTDYDHTMQSFAIEIHTSVDYLIKCFADIGIIKKKSDFVTQKEKEILLKYISNGKNTVFNQLTLQRKTRSTLNISSAGGKNKQVQVEVRKKRTYMQCTATNIANIVDEKDKKQIISDIDEKISALDIIEKNQLVNTRVEQTVDLFLSASSNSTKISIHSQDIKLQKKTEKQVRSAYPISEKQSQNVSKVTGSLLLKKGSNLHYSWNQSVKPSIDISRNHALTTENYNHNKLFSVSDLSENNSYYHQKSETKKNRTRTRTRVRTGTKLIKQKRNNNHRIYDEVIRHEEELCLPNRTYKNKKKQSALVQSFKKPAQSISRNIVIGDTISVAELSNRLSMKSAFVIKAMSQLGLIVTIDQMLDQETAQLVAEEMGHKVILRRENELEEFIMHDRNTHINKIDDFIYENRPPIVTIMGHVDHGKTSLLDYIRATKLVSVESGGITQKIGAYYVNVRDNQFITFLDTPGHAAFTAMRTRGVQLTDIVVLVIAADDGVMPQTIEAIHHIKSINIPVVVAINKIDKLEANPDRIKNELNSYGFIPEEWGGDIQFVNISACSGLGVNSLLDAILLQAEILELKTIRNGMASAVVIESFIDKGRGPVIIALVREGVLKCGDIILCGTEYGRIRAMRNEHGSSIISAGPSIPVELLGLSGSPESGEKLIVVHNEKKAKEVALYRKDKFRAIKLTRKQEESYVNNVFDNVKKNAVVIPELNIIVKADTKGSLEAICSSLKELSNNMMVIKILSASIGSIVSSDVILSVSSTNAVILGFNVKSDASARRIVEANRINIRYHSVIYNLLNEVKEIINSMLTPENCKFEVIGIAQVRNVFCLPKFGNIAGCIVIDGMMKRNKKIRLIRENVVIHEGELESLRRFKSDVHEVRSGIECGIAVKNYSDIRSGDTIEVVDSIMEIHK